MHQEKKTSLQNHAEFVLAHTRLLTTRSMLVSAHCLSFQTEGIILLFAD